MVQVTGLLCMLGDAGVNVGEGEMGETTMRKSQANSPPLNQGMGKLAPSGTETGTNDSPQR